MYDDNYDIPGAFPALNSNAPQGGGFFGGGGGGGGFEKMLDNPMIMGGLMGLSNLRDPNSMSNALQAMMQMRQGNQMMDYRNRSLEETSRYHGGALDLEKTKAEIMRQQMQAQTEQQRMVQGLLPSVLARFQPGGQQPTGATAQVMQQAPPVSDAQPTNNPSAYTAPPQRDQGGPTDPVYDNRSFAQGQPLPPAGQPQPAPGQAGQQQMPQQQPPINSGFMGADSFVRKAEGGFTPNDAGAGPTNYGINQRANPDVDVKNLTPDQAANIRKTRYWDKIGGDTLPPATAAVAYDAAINQGVGYATNLLERTGGNPALMLQQRKQDYAELGKQERFKGELPGWNKRLDNLKASLEGMDTNAQSPMQQAAAQAAPPQAAQGVGPQAGGPQAAPEGIAQVPGLPQIPGMAQQPSGQQGVTAPDDSEQRRQQVAMGLVLTANPHTMAEGMKMINEAGQTKTYNKGQIVTNADGKPIMVDGPPTAQEAFNNQIAAGRDYREALDSAMKVGKYPRELKKMDAEYQDTLAQTTERQAQAKHIDQTVANTNTSAELGNLSMTQAIGSLRQSYENLNKAGAITNTDKSAKENAIASLVYQSGPGQVLGQMVGSKVQTDLNDIAMAKPQLLAGLMHSSGIKSTQMNSDKELQFYVSMATDPKAGYQSNIKALDHLEQYAKWASQHQQATNTTFGAYLADSGQSVPPAGSGTAPLGSQNNPMTLDQYNKSRK